MHSGCGRGSRETALGCGTAGELPATGIVAAGLGTKVMEVEASGCFFAFVVVFLLRSRHGLEMPGQVSKVMEVEASGCFFTFGAGCFLGGWETAVDLGAARGEEGA